MDDLLGEGALKVKEKQCPLSRRAKTSRYESHSGSRGSCYLFAILPAKPYVNSLIPIDGK